MKKIFIILGFVIALTVNCFSQKQHISLESSKIRIDSLYEGVDMRIPLIKIMGQHLNSKALFRLPKNNSFLFSIAFYVNTLGNIEDVYFSDLSPKNALIINPNQDLIQDFRKILISENRYRDKILILSILFKRPNDTNISNLDEILNDYTKLWPSLSNVKILKKQTILLKPFVNNFFDPIE